jgi:hypothetical protein
VAEGEGELIMAQRFHFTNIQSDHAALPFFWKQILIFWKRLAINCLVGVALPTSIDNYVIGLGATHSKRDPLETLKHHQPLLVNRVESALPSLPICGKRGRGVNPSPRHHGEKLS